MSRKHELKAIIYDKRGKILSIGQNSYIKTHPLQARCARAVGEPTKIFLHAEIAALVACKDWRSATKIAIFRFTKEGKPAPAKPCKCCQHAIKLAGISNIEHT